MTCQELRSHFEENRDSGIGTDRGSAAEHISACADCSRFVEEQRALAQNLTSMRELAGQVPESLDAVVVGRYRQFVAQRVDLPASNARPLFAWWAWGAAVAAVLAATAFWVMSKHAATTAKTAPPTPPITVPAAQVTTANAAAHPPARDVASNVSTRAIVKRRPVAGSGSEAPVRLARSLPEGFRSLMYCDELSCPEGMDMIRVQLPASAMHRALPGFIQTSGSVTADVLIGPDGIARGIRYEEIEF
jgi:hypothetical protein